MNKIDDMTDSCLEEYLKFINKLMGITIPSSKKVMICGRVRSRLREVGLSQYDEYLEYLTKNKKEEEFFINAITTNETYFYRTPRVWDYIEDVFLPEYVQRSSSIKIWSAASSTGEEAYTLGVVCENLKAQKRNFNYSVLGTDINSSVVERAEFGLYKGRAIQRFRDSKKELFSSYMKGSDDNGFQVITEIKNKIKFGTHNLFEDFKRREKFDLILLRNVLIYFNRADQEKVLNNIYKQLNKNGKLIIGESESLNQLDSKFKLVTPLVYERIEDFEERDAA